MPFKMERVPDAAIYVLYFSSLSDELSELTAELQDVNQAICEVLYRTNGPVYFIYDFSNIHLSYLGITIMLAQKNLEPRHYAKPIYPHTIIVNKRNGAKIASELASYLRFREIPMLDSLDAAVRYALHDLYLSKTEEKTIPQLN